MNGNVLAKPLSILPAGNSILSFEGLQGCYAFYTSAIRIAKMMAPASTSLYLYVGGPLKIARVVNYNKWGLGLSYIAKSVCTVVSRYYNFSRINLILPYRLYLCRIGSIFFGTGELLCKVADSVPCLIACSSLFSKGGMAVYCVMAHPHVVFASAFLVPGKWFPRFLELR